MKNSFIRIISLFLIALLCVLSLASCASDDKGVAYEEIGNDMNGTMDGVGNGPPEKGEANNDSDFIKDKNAKIIRNINTRGETKDFDAAYEAIKSYISEADGYVESSDIRGGKSYEYERDSERTANFVIRIPAEKLDGFNEKVEKLLNITSFSENTTDVSLEYADIESRLQTLKSKKVALEAMLEKATTMNEIITIQDSLYDVIADIEAYQSQLNVYDNKVNYSTVNLSVCEVIEYTEIEEEDPSFGKRIANAFTKTWAFFWELCLDITVGLVWIMPYIIIPVIIVLIIILIAKLSKKKKNKANTDNNE